MVLRERHHPACQVSQVKDYLASIGAKGGKAGTGKAKKRTKAQYQAMAKKSAAVRKAKRSTSSGDVSKK
jgi:hypothetical protein